jgi:hypothetical protein
VHPWSRMFLRQISVIKFDESMQGQLFFTSCEINDECSGDVAEGVEFV